MNAAHHAYAAALRAAAFAAARDARQTSAALLHLRAFADACGLTVPARVKPAPLAIPAARAALIDTTHALTSAPSPATLRAFLRALAALSGSLLRAHDSLPVRLLKPNARGEPAPSPRVRTVPPGALTWQTSPAIGCDPAHIAALAQQAAPRARKPRKPRKPRPVAPATVAPATVARPHVPQFATVLTLRR